MVAEPGRLDYWRKYFRSANSDIFDVIEHAILVAASDCPQEFRVQRDRIAEKLFSCQLARCHGCDRVKQQLPQESDDDAGCAEKESKVDGIASEREEDVNRAMRNYSYDEAEALTEEIEEETQAVREVFRIKETLSNKEHEPDSVLYESLRRLQLMALSVDVLKVTEIGKAVNGLRKHRSREIRHLVRTLIDGWKVVVDEWVHASADLTESTPESMNPSGVYNDEGLPSPPLDEGLLFSSRTTMELSQFFDGMDDDGNHRNNGNSERRPERGRRPPPPPRGGGGPRPPPRRSQETAAAEVVDRRAKLQEFFVKPQEYSARQAGRPQKAVTGDGRSRQRQEPAAMQKKPAAGPDKSTIPEDSSVRAKLEAAKRKLHERYQQAENAKKQRTIQVMELQDIPNQSRQPLQKQGNHGWSWASGRR
ncbi:unnamed protein product [Spirodela intermedia]|uniref:TFIIS N-terminal domain-containing protein n=1 Tax=Spirodela intermedia TaxID=51605 RepID=A0A7I8IVD4_SPIIN|nr:unnamed protein product [Spirodela intermedia]CAA6661965.1 unnamed protein product [Spirodela intermedia]